MENQEIPLFDIYDYMYVPFWQQRWFYYLMLIMGFMLVGIGLYLIVKMFLSRAATRKKPWEIAIEQVKALDYRKTKHKELYFRLTDILKTYFTLRYGVPLRDKTDQEVIAILENGLLPSQSQELIKEVFSAPLFIKFANEQAGFERMQHDIAASIALIEQTKFQEGA